MDSTLKNKKCAHCKTEFQPFRPLQKVCSPKCATEIVRIAREKQERKDTRERKEKLKTRSDWLKEVQVEFNRYIRARDKSEPCISCGRFHQGQWHAGHYRSVAAAPNLRFDENNVHKQCAPCNNHKSGNIVEYRIRLVAKIGIEEVQIIESDNKAKHYTIEELKELKAYYRNKWKELDGLES